jgi:hypothetical protein
MAAKTHYLNNAILNAVLKNSGSIPTPATLYVALNTSASTPSTPGTECADANYTRQTVTFGTVTATFVHSNVVLNFFGAGAATGATIVEVAIYDQVTGGNELYYAPVSPSVVVGAGDTAQLANGNLTVTENGTESQYFSQALLNAVLKAAAYTNPTTVYGALNTTTSTNTVPGTEVVDGSYARIALSFGTPASGVVASNTVTSFFGSGVATGPYTVVEFAIYDQVTGGNELFYGNLTSPKTVNAGDTLFFASGNITVTES